VVSKVFVECRLLSDEVVLKLNVSKYVGSRLSHQMIAEHREKYSGCQFFQSATAPSLSKPALHDMLVKVQLLLVRARFVLSNSPVLKWRSIERRR
jgi:hypothetical protein